MKRKKFTKRMLAAGLAVVVAASLAGCGNDSKSTKVSSGEKKEISFPLEEKKTLKLITKASASSTQKPNERAIFQRLEERTNVAVDWTCYVSDQFSDKKNLALSKAGSLPDGMFNADMSDYELLRYAKQGVVIPVEDLIDAYMPNLKKILKENQEYKKMLTATDGHIYSFPWIEQLGQGKEAIQTIGDIPWINKKWLDYLGLSMPSTTEELENTLKEFQKNSAKLQAEFSIQGDVIPLSFIINNGDQDPAILMNGFGEGYGDTADHLAVTDDKEVICTAAQEGYKEGIKWLHQLQSEGLIDPEAYTQDWSTYVAKGKNERYGLCFTWDIANVANNQDYVAMPALAGPDGIVNITRQNGSETSGFDRGRCVLTSKCEDTALAASWLDLMYDPLQSVQNNWGSYGETDKFNVFELTEKEEGNQMLTHIELGDESPVEVREAQNVGGPLAILNSYYGTYVTCPDDAQWRLDILKNTYVKDMNTKYTYPKVFMSQEDTTAANQYSTDLKQYIEQMKAEWIMNGGVDKGWDAYLEKLEEYGLSKYLKIQQEYFDDYYAKDAKTGESD